MITSCSMTLGILIIIVLYLLSATAKVLVIVDLEPFWLAEVGMKETPMLLEQAVATLITLMRSCPSALGNILDKCKWEVLDKLQISDLLIA